MIDPPEILRHREMSLSGLLHQHNEYLFPESWRAPQH